MSNVIIDREKIDILANAISDKSGVPVTMTLDEMVEAVDGIETGGGGITPTGNIDITQSGVTDVTNYASATVNALASQYAELGVTKSYKTENGQRKWVLAPYFQNAGNDGGMVNGYARFGGEETIFNAIATGTSVTPTESAQTIGGSNTMMEGAVTVNAIPSNYVGSGITRQTSLNGFEEDGSYWVEGSSGYYPNYVDIEVPSGTAGTPTATKGTVSNHSISVTPSVTNTTGYITGSTKTGTAVTVTASELVSGSQTITSNGTYDVTNLASIVAAIGAGADIPIFTVDLTASPATATCNKTYAECVSAYNNDYEAWGIANVTTQYSTIHMATSVVEYQQNAYLRYAMYNERGIPAIDLMYYPNDSVAVVNPSGLLVEADTPIATKGTVSNHSVSVTPSVTNTAGYIVGGPKTGTAVTVSASELVSGTYTVSASGTHDVTNYASASVASGSATAPASISGTSASITTGTNTITLTKTVSVTPSVTAGYVSSGTSGNSSVSLTASVTTKAAATITPTTTNQTIAAGTYLTGTQTIAGDADLVGSNILSTANIFGVQGTVVVQNYYTGSSAPSSSLGSNGDLYLQS